MKKVFTIFVALILMMSTILMTPGIGGKVQAAAVNGLTGIDVSYTDANNTPQYQITDETTIIKLKYNFGFASTGGSGQVSAFQLPSNVFKLPAAANNVDLIHNNQKIGTYTITTDGKVTLNFLPNLSDVEASFNFTTWINPIPIKFIPSLYFPKNEAKGFSVFTQIETDPEYFLFLGNVRRVYTTPIRV